MYEQVLRRFSKFPKLRLATRASIKELAMIAMDPRVPGQWTHESDEDKAQVAQVNYIIISSQFITALNSR
jgi:hypothetical protein